MTFRRTLTVFMGSPGDLPDERNAVQATIEEMNRILANRAGFHLDLVRWEDSAPGFGNPQERLNQDLARADLFLGMLNRRWGSPPAKDSPYSSGFEEEYRRSLDRRTRSGAPEMMLLFKYIAPEFMTDVGPDLRKVIDFQNELIETKPVLFKTFNDVADLQQQLRAYLSAWLHSLGEMDRRDIREDLAEAPVQATEIDLRELPAFSSEGAAFLTSIANVRRQSGQLDAAETARLRLLGTHAGRSGQNDAHTLGPHDANLLYVSYPAKTFGLDEISGLIAAGYSLYSSKTAPLWTWLMRRNSGLAEGMAIDTVALQPRERVGALRALQFVGLEPKAEGLTRQDFVSIWLGKNQDRNVKSAALLYLSEMGVEEDLDALFTAHADKDAGQLDEVAFAILAILDRTNRLKAFRSLLDLAPTTPPAPLIDRIFSVANTVPDEWLIEALSHRAPRVRLAALTASERLTSRIELVRALTKDDDPEVRAAAVSALEAEGEVLTLDDAKALLVRSTRNALLWSIASPSSSSGQVQWRFYRRRALQSWSNEQLRQAAQRNHDADAILALARADKEAVLLREIVDREGGVEFAGQPAVQDTWITTPAIDSDSTAALYAGAIKLIASRSDSSDLPRLRKAFDNAGVELPEAAYQFIATHGDWSDVERIRKATDERRGRQATNLLSITDRSAEYRWAAKALVTLGGGQWERLLSLQWVAGVMRNLILAAPQRVWRLMSDDVLLEVLQDLDETVRELAALRCVRDLPVKRMRTLLEAYMALEQTRYYNSIHWLDFGTAVPRDLTIGAARRSLDRSM